MKWAKLCRRGAALLIAALTLWWLAASGNGDRAVAQVMATGASRAANWTLWERLILRQSPFLRAGQALTSPASSPPPTFPAEPTPVATPTPTPAPEDEPPIPSNSHADTKVIAQTLLPTTDGSYSSAGGVFLYNRTNLAVDMEALAAQPVELTGSSTGPQILIIHTHATEAYTPEGGDNYAESDPYRTTDEGHNVLRVGDEMAAAFAQAGLNVLHDRTLHDYPNYAGAYTRSKETVEKYLAQYPSISIVLDVHRDALMAKEDTICKVMADQTVAEDTAQVMLVVGTNAGGNEHPDWRKNLTFAMALEKELNAQMPTLARPITLRGSAFNQNLSVGSLLIEVGTHGNTLQEAVNGARAFAQTVAPVIKDLL